MLGTATLFFESAGRRGRGALLVVAFLVPALFAPPHAESGGTRAHERPNVIIISVDTLRVDHLGCAGYGRKPSPHIDALAQSLVVFENCHSQASWTAPSVASLFTGLYPTQHGSIGRDRVMLDDANLTMADIMQDGGYYTAGFSASPFIHPEFGFGQGFAEFEFEASENAGALNAMIESGLAALEQKSRDMPLFLYVMYFDPHFPYQPPPGYAERFNRDPGGVPLWKKSHVTKIDTLFELRASVGRETYEYLKSAYDGEIAYADEKLGALVRKLESAGLLDFERDIVIVTSDHGEEFLEHGRFGHGNTLYQETIHVPLLLSAPGIESKRKVKSVVRQIDLLPTLAELANIELPRKVEGRSLAPLLKGLAPEHDRPAFASCRHLFLEGHTMRSLRRGDYKLILFENPGRAELYDLASDPYEQQNLAVQNPAILESMTDALVGIEKQMLAPVTGPDMNPDPERTRKLLETLGYLGK